ncbi:MAG: hypothetical protein ACUVWK_06690 [Nitrososphaerales archaeon]
MGIQNLNLSPSQKERFYGFIEEEIAGTKVNIPTREKTTVERLMHPKYCGGLEAVAKGIWRAKDNMDLKKLLEYAKRVKVFP